MPPRIAGGVRCSCITIQNCSKMGCSLSRWHECVEHMPQSGHPPVNDENVQLVSALVEVDRNVTICQLEQDTGLAHSTVLHILKDLLKMRKIAFKWVLHDLIDMHKWQRYDAFRMHLQHYECEGEAFLRRIIAIDETWAKSYEPELKCQSKEWRHHGNKQFDQPPPM